MLLTGAAWDRTFDDDGDITSRGGAHDAEGVGGDGVGVHGSGRERPPSSGIP